VDRLETAIGSGEIVFLYQEDRTYFEIQFFEMLVLCSNLKPYLVIANDNKQEKLASNVKKHRRKKLQQIFDKMFKRGKLLSDQHDK
jgi:hypothetical protein